MGEDLILTERGYNIGHVHEDLTRNRFRHFRELVMNCPMDLSEDPTKCMPRKVKQVHIYSESQDCVGGD